MAAPLASHSFVAKQLPTTTLSYIGWYQAADIAISDAIAPLAKTFERSPLWQRPTDIALPLPVAVPLRMGFRGLCF